jgi:hypothetical protein
MLTKNIWKRLLPSLLLGLSAVAYGSLVAEDSTGLVVAARGTVSAQSTGGERALKQGDSIFVEDQIVTGDKSFAVVQFSDGAKVTVRPNSAMIVEEYVYNGGSDDAATLSLVEGGLRVITGAMTKQDPESYKVKTPVALMGVRGTEFAVMLCDEEVCEQEETE